jgi:hypothetical protein
MEGSQHRFSSIWQKKNSHQAQANGYSNYFWDICKFFFFFSRRSSLIKCFLARSHTIELKGHIIVPFEENRKGSQQFCAKFSSTETTEEFEGGNFEKSENFSVRIFPIPETYLEKNKINFFHWSVFWFHTGKKNKK